MLIISLDQFLFPLPFCYCFCPSKKDIFCIYLRAAIRGDPLFSNSLIIEREIYDENREPWNVFDKAKTRSFWIFTKLKKKSKPRIDRTAGSGTWLNRGVKEVKDERGQLLGFDQYFTFICKKDQSLSQNSNGRWIMHEFSLSDQGLSDYVICQIKNKDVVGSNDDQNNSKAEVESINQKRNASKLVNDEELSVPTAKKTCVDESKPNQGNGNGNAEWNGSSTPTNIQETHDPTKLLMIDCNSPEGDWNDKDLASLMNELNYIEDDFFENLSDL